MEGKATTFCTIFPSYRDYHFFKDPGQVPYRFARLGYDTTLVCYRNKSSFPETEKHMKVRILPDRWMLRKFNSAIIIYLFFNSRRIDILNTFHLNWSSLLFVGLYKLFNRKGFAYVKLDNCIFSGKYPWEEDYASEKPAQTGHRKLKRRLKGSIARHFFLNKVDLWSVEDEYSREQYEQKYAFFKGKLITVYNGHTSDLPGSAPPCGLNEKEDIIMTAGRLGAYQKATEVLLEAFRTVASQSSYDLHLAGSVETGFLGYIEDFFRSNPGLKQRVFFHGPLGRDELYGLYRKSKIFCISSRYEGMAIVFPEAMYYSNAIVTTWPVSLKYLIDKHEAGLAVETDNPNALAEALLRLINDGNLMAGLAQNARSIAETQLNWNNIISQLEEEIKNRMHREKHTA